MYDFNIVDSEYGSIVVRIDKFNGSRTFFQRGWMQSISDMKGISQAPYIHAIFDLIEQTLATTILMIGCGGGTLATMLAGRGKNVTIVDINPVAIDVAHRFFALDQSIPCFVEDGLKWLGENPTKFDCIVLDAFEGGRMPQHLCTKAFFEVARERLTDVGVMVVNVVEEIDFSYANLVAKNIAENGFRVTVLSDGRPSEGNVIVIGSHSHDFVKPRLRILPEGEVELLEDELDWYVFWSLPITVKA